MSNKPEPIVWDSYKSDVRIVLTIVLLIAAVIIHLLGYPMWSWIPIPLAAIAFHTECKFILDPATRTFERRYFVKPFGSPDHGSFEEIAAIELSLNTWTEGESFKAHLVFEQKERRRRHYCFARGLVGPVVKEAQSVHAITNRPIAESRGFKAFRERNRAIAKILETPPAPDSTVSSSLYEL